jgi:hypothetical protein
MRAAGPGGLVAARIRSMTVDVYSDGVLVCVLIEVVGMVQWTWLQYFSPTNEEKCSLRLPSTTSAGQRFSPVPASAGRRPDVIASPTCCCSPDERGPQRGGPPEAEPALCVLLRLGGNDGAGGDGERWAVCFSRLSHFAELAHALTCCLLPRPRQSFRRWPRRRRPSSYLIPSPLFFFLRTRRQTNPNILPPSLPLSPPSHLSTFVGYQQPQHRTVGLLRLFQLPKASSRPDAPPRAQHDRACAREHQPASPPPPPPTTTTLSSSIMSRNNVAALKFVGTGSLGLLTVRALSSSPSPP